MNQRACELYCTVVIVLESYAVTDPSFAWQWLVSGVALPVVDAGRAPSIHDKATRHFAAPLHILLRDDSWRAASTRPRLGI